MSLIPLHIVKRMGKVWLYFLLLYMPCRAVAQDGEVETDTVVAPPVEEIKVETVVDEETEDDDIEYKQHIPEPASLRQVPDSVVRRLKEEEEFAYANDPEYWAKMTPPKDGDYQERKSFGYRFFEFFQGSGVKTFIYILLGVGLVLLIYRLIVVNNLLTTSTRRDEAAAEEEMADIDDNNLDGKIQAAIQEKNYRPAVRLMYIKALRALNEKGWIRYHAQSTNYEYVNQVQPYGVGNEFRFITHVYEYVWYGEFILSDAQFSQVQQNFQHFFNTIKA
jgi:hypothetical protein